MNEAKWSYRLLPHRNKGRCKASAGYAPEPLFLALKLQKLDLRNRIKADALDALLFLKANADHIDNLAKL